jgi:hypothetical protein
MMKEILMNRKETIGIMAIIKANYPMYYKDKSKQELQSIVNLWHEMFKDDNADLVIRAVKMFIATDNKGFPPVIGQIKNRLVELTSSEQMTEQEAWNLVKKAVGRSGWHAEEEFEKLPPVIKKLVGSPTQLKEWALMETDSFDTVVGSNFMRSYKVKAKQIKEYETLPNDVKDFLNGVSDKLSLENKGDEK